MLTYNLDKESRIKHQLIRGEHPEPHAHSDLIVSPSPLTVAPKPTRGTCVSEVFLNPS